MPGIVTDPELPPEWQAFVADRPAPIGMTYRMRGGDLVMHARLTDLEADPYECLFDVDGIVTLLPNNYAYLLLSGEMLQALHDMQKAAENWGRRNQKAYYALVDEG